jgi:diguanylate cyclase (GGDEF)-like protein/PAS domain S-box-containing protein
VHKLFTRQIAKASKTAGGVDLDALGALVSSAYDESDRDRRRTDRSISLMIDELDQLNRNLERLVAERTAALRQREAELSAQNLRFDAALNNMSQALLMFDSSGHLAICNDRYLEMYGLSPEQVKVGCTLRDILEIRRATGTFPDEPKDYVEHQLPALARGKSISRVHQLPDGRTISVLTHPIADGGWISTHEDITERRRAEEQISHMARHDSLTDLPNRLLLRERIEEALPRMRRGGRLAVLYLDLDHFKTVNDTLGHHIGDELLKAVAVRLRSIVRASDTVARMGGDEFVVVQAEAERPNETAALAQRICESLRAPFDLNGNVVVVQASVGIAMAPDDGGEPNELLKNADIALYGIKSDGRGSYRFFEPEMDARMKARRELELALRSALVEGRFELLYQPLVSLKDNRVTCCEALLRWNHPERGVVSPAEFIPVAEEIGVIVTIGEWVMRKACADAARWPADVKVAVNLSPIQVMNPNLVSMVVGALASASLPANRLEVEITESVLLQNCEATLNALHNLRGLGVSISMDDFGTGFSSLSSLRSFPFSKIKIDRCFINGLSEEEDSLAIVRAVSGLAKNLGMITTAEGVETERQMEQVRALGCTEMQGYLFSPPVKAQDLWPLFSLHHDRKSAAG